MKVKKQNKSVRLNNSLGEFGCFNKIFPDFNINCTALTGSNVFRVPLLDIYIYMFDSKA